MWPPAGGGGCGSRDPGRQALQGVPSQEFRKSPGAQRARLATSDAPSQVAMDSHGWSGPSASSPRTGGGGVAQPGEALAKVLGFSRSQSRGAPRPQLTFPWRGDCSPPPTSLWSHLGAWGFALTFASSLCPRSWAPGLSVSKGLAAFVQGMYTPLLTYFPSLNSLFRFYAWDMCGGVGRGELFPPPCTKLSCFHLVQGLGEVRAG